MSLSDDLKTVLDADVALAALLTGGIFTGVEEISRANTPGAFDDTTKEIRPCALLKLPNENQAGPYKNSARTSIVIYLYQRQGYDVIEPAMSLVIADLNDKKIGSNVWSIEWTGAVYQQRDQALDCALGSLRFMAVRLV